MFFIKDVGYKPTACFCLTLEFSSCADGPKARGHKIYYNYSISNTRCDKNHKKRLKDPRCEDAKRFKDSKLTDERDIVMSPSLTLGVIKN